MLALLEKTRMINKLLQNTEVISYKKMAEVLKDVIKANIYIVSSEGELLGYSIPVSYTHLTLPTILRV